MESNNAALKQALLDQEEDSVKRTKGSRDLFEEKEQLETELESLKASLRGQLYQKDMALA